MRFILRSIMGIVIAGIVAVALVPILVLRDLGSGGTGWGICQEGLDGCSTSYFAGFELVAILLVILFGLLGVYRLALKALRRTEHQYDRRRSAQAVSETAFDVVDPGVAGGPVGSSRSPAAGNGSLGRHA